MSSDKVDVGNPTYTKDNHKGKSSANHFWIIHGMMLPLHHTNNGELIVHTYKER